MGFVRAGLSTKGYLEYRLACQVGEILTTGRLKSVPSLQKWTKVTLCHQQHFYVPGGCTSYLLLCNHSLSPHCVPSLERK